MPASTRPATLVFLAVESVSATPYSPSAKPDMLEPRQRPAAIGVEIALLLGQRLIERLVDQRQRLAHRERFALGVEHLGVARVDRHARPDGRLRQVHRRDVAALEVEGASGSSALSAVTNSRRVAVGASAARGRQTRTMLEARALVRYLDSESARSVRIGQVPVMAKPARITASRKVSQPVLAVPSSLIALGLLECVVDGDRKGWMRLLGEPMHCLRHAVEEESLGLFLAAMAIGRGNQLLRLGHGERGEQIREDWPQRAAQPDIEEVR